MCIGGRTLAQGLHPSAVEAPGAYNGQLPWRRSLLTTPFPKPHWPRSVGVRAEGPRLVWGRGGLLSGQGVLNLYQPPRKAISAFLGPAPDLSFWRIRSPVGPRRPGGRHGEVPRVLISILGKSRPSLYGSGRGQVSFQRAFRRDGNQPTSTGTYRGRARRGWLV